MWCGRGNGIVRHRNLITWSRGGCDADDDTSNIALIAVNLFNRFIRINIICCSCWTNRSGLRIIITQFYHNGARNVMHIFTTMIISIMDYWSNGWRLWCGYPWQQCITRTSWCDYDSYTTITMCILCTGYCIPEGGRKQHNVIITHTLMS